MPRKPTRYSNHPIVKYVRSLSEEFYLGREVAEMLGSSIEHLSYLRRRSPTPMGPTHQARYGATVLHLYTPQRIAQISEYMKQVSGIDRGLQRRGPPVLWTRTETHLRRREFDRARTYRNRAAIYRGQGMEPQAVELEQRSTELLAELEKTRTQRRKKIGGNTKK